MENMGMNRSFWKDKSVFLTGHTGFKGGWASIWLQRRGANVTGYALEPTDENCLFYQARVGDGVRSFFADVRDGSKLQSVMAEVKPEVAFHFAAQPLVRESYAKPVDTYATNVMGTVHFLEAVRQTPSVRVAIIVTSDKCYENRELQQGFLEDDPMGGDDPYSSSKGCAELITSAYRRSFLSDNQVAVASVRAGNVIGGGDWAKDRLVPDLVRAFADGITLQIRYPHAVRPWQHVLEPLRGYLMLAEQLWNNGGAFAGGFNFGPRDEDAWTVSKVVNLASSLWENDSEWTSDNTRHLHEAHYLKLDCSKAGSRLDWVPVFRLEETLDWTISWYRTHLAGLATMRDFTEQQIGRYENLVDVATNQTTTAFGAINA
jgi:CDP-glucose 4,6-dehydratase